MRSSIATLTSLMLAVTFYAVFSTDVAAQYRSSVGCPAAAVLNPDISLAELQCKCFKKCPTLPTTDSPTTTSPPVEDPRRFKTVEGRDIDGNDYRRVTNVNFEACVSECKNDNQCVAFSFDKWNRYCFLKHVIPDTLRIEPNSIVGVISTASPRDSNAPVRIERFRKKAFPDTPYKQLPASSLEQCEAACNSEDKCEVLTYAKTQNLCKLIARPGEWWRDELADSGVKRQIP